MLTNESILFKMQNKLKFSDAELKGMSIDELRRVVGELAPQYRASLKAVGLDSVTVDAQVDAMVSSQDAAELVKSADVMQKELGFGEDLQENADILNQESNNDTIRDNQVFRSDADPIRKILGKATESHPQEVEAIKKHCSELGVKIVERSGSMAYSPGLSPGQKGTLIIDPDASISAWRHEYQHVMDDCDAGWSGFRIFEDQDATWEREKRAYELELKLAEELQDQEAYSSLQKLMEERKIEIYEK